MAKLKLKLDLGPVKIDVEKEDYVDAWHEHCDNEGDMEEGDFYPPISDAFVVEQVQEELEDGTRDLAEAFESATVEVTLA